MGHVDNQEIRAIETVAQPPARVSRERLGGIGIAAGAVLLIGYVMTGGGGKGGKNITDADGEAFKSGVAGMSAPADVAKNVGRLVIEPTKEAQPAGAPAVDLEELRRQEAARLAAEEAARRAAAEAADRERRLMSPLVVVDNSEAPATAQGGDGKAPDSPVSFDEDKNRAWGRGVGSAGVETARASRNSRLDAFILQGTIIRGALHTAIQSDLPGMVTANVSEDVWSADGRRVLIPKGSRLVGEYRSGLARGQTRVFVIWTRVMTPAGLSVEVASGGTDYLGRAGLTGEVDRHYFERFGSSVLLSVVGGGASYLAGVGGSGASAATSTVQTPAQQGQALAAQTTSQEMTKLASAALSESINIPPTIHVDQGETIIVLVKRDLDFSKFYPDPVTEALRELKYGGRGAVVRGSGVGAAQGLVRKP